MGRLSEFLNMNMALDTFTPKLLRHGIFNDVDFDPAHNLAVMEGEKIVGFMAGTLRTHFGENTRQGLIKLFAVREDYRRRGIAGSLLARLENMFREAGATEITIGYDGAIYFLGGCDPRYTEAYLFLRKKGFEQYGEALFLSADLRKPLPDISEIEKNLSAKGIQIVRARMEEKQEVSEWISEEFGEGWARETELAFRENDVTVWLAKKDGEVCGFAVGEAAFWGNFGPVGVQESLRGNRIGAVLLVRTLEDMGRHGDTVAWICTGRDRIAWYHRSCNARIDRIFWRMKKQLAAPAK